MPKKAHLTYNRVRHDASDTKALTIVLHDIDRKAAGGNEIEGVGGLASVIEHL